MPGFEHVRDYPYPTGFDSLEKVEGWARDIWKQLNEAEHGFAEDLELTLSQKSYFTTITGITNDVVADQQGDTLTLATGNSTLGIVGTAATDTITWTWAHLGFESLSDPGADRIPFWDDGESALKWLAPDGTTIEISGTTLQVLAGGLDHGGLSGLGDDDHLQYIKDSEFTQDSGFLVGTGSGTFAEETGATARASIGLPLLDEDDFISNSDISVATQQSIKAYVDNSIHSIIEQYLTDAIDGDVAAYLVMDNEETGQGESTVVLENMGTGDDQPIEEWITPLGGLGAHTLVAGIYELHLHAERTDGGRTVQLYWELWTRTSVGGETKRGESEVTGAVTSKEVFDPHLVITDDVDLDTADRIVVKLYANASATPNNDTDVTIYMEGTVESHLRMPTPFSTISDIFVRHDLVTAVSDFLVASGSGVVVKKTLAETGFLLESDMEHGNIQGLGDDDHSQYILHSLADAANDFLVASGANTFVKKTLSETGTILEGDIDHSNIVNTHNLTSDIDHGSIAGLDDGDHDAVYYTETEIDTWRNSVTQTEMGYVNGVTSDIQTQLDARALESVLGTSIGAGLLLDGAVLKTDIELQAIAGLTSAADRYIRFTGSGTADLRTYANVLVDLSGEATGTFNFNTQVVDNISALGIGLTNPQKAIDIVSGGLRIKGGAASFELWFDATPSFAAIFQTQASSFRIGTFNGSTWTYDQLIVDTGGNATLLGVMRANGGFSDGASAGVDGSFTAGSGETVTVSGGIITNIV